MRSALAWFVIKRLLGVVVLLVVMSFVVFSLLFLEPGSVVKDLLGTRPVNAQTVATIKAEYHLNDSFLGQYWIWIKDALGGNFGTSVQSGSPVGGEIASRLPLTLELVLFAFVLGVVTAIPLGIIAGFRAGGIVDRSAVTGSIVFLSAPPFALGLILLYLFANDLSWFPIYGSGSGFGSRADHLVLPALTLALGLGGFLLKITRAAVIRETGQDYVMFARARGLGNRQVAMLVLRNACLPVLTSMGLALVYLFGSTVLVEQTFSLPGLGSLLEEAVTFKDVPVVQALTLLIAAVIAITAVVVDLAYLALDPQLRTAVTDARPRGWRQRLSPRRPAIPTDPPVSN